MPVDINIKDMEKRFSHGEMSEEDQAEFLQMTKGVGDKAAVEIFIAKQVELQLWGYKKAVKIGDVKDNAQEQEWTVAMHNLVGELWTSIITKTIEASERTKLPANYALNALLHAAAEAAAMSIDSYRKAGKLQGVTINTAKLSQDFATGLGGEVLRQAHKRGLV